MDIKELVDLTKNCTNRDDGFKKLIHKFECRVGVEIGVREGYFSDFLLQGTELEKLYGIDCHRHGNIINVENQFKDRYKYIQDNSIKAAEQFDNNSLDFIYHDSDHSEWYVYEELNIWWPKAKSGAVICGDDYMEFYVAEEGHFGVIPALNRFVAEKSLDFAIIGQDIVDKEKITEYGIFMGRELTKRQGGQPNAFTQVPNWYLIKP